MTKTEEQLKKLEIAFANHEQVLLHIRGELDFILSEVHDERSQTKKLDQDVRNVVADQRLLSQHVEDLNKRIDTWGTRVWSIVTILITAVISLATGLIVASLRRTP